MNRSIFHKNSFFIPLIPVLFYLPALGYMMVAGMEKYTAVLTATIIVIPVLWILLFRFRFFAYLIILLIPLSVKTYLGGGAALSFPGELLTATAALFGISYYLIRRNESHINFLKHPLTLIILTDIGWSLFTAFLAEDTGVAFKRITIKIIFILVFYFLYSGYFRSLKNIAMVFLLYAAGMVIPIVHTLINHSHYEFSKTVSFLMPLPFYNDHTLYATCIAFIFPVILLLLFRPDWYGIRRSPVLRVSMLLLLILLSTGELFAFSRAAWLSIAFSMAFAALVVFFRFRLVHFLLIFILSAGIIYQYSHRIFLYTEKVDAVSRDENVGEHMRSVINIQTDASNLERINRWSCALKMAADKPLTGFGPGNYLNVYGRYQVTSEMTRISTNHGEKGNAHSEYLMYLSEMGLPGLVIIIALILVTLSRGIAIIRKSPDPRTRWLTLAIMTGFVSYFFHGLFNSFIDTDKASVLVYSSLAAITMIDLIHFRQKTSVSGIKASERGSHGGQTIS